jgi:2-amino-4-hydroxy-6-hydroxymethyldihydropteridine diphosphokinase
VTQRRQAFVGLGTNLGDRTAILRGAISTLRSHFSVCWLEPSSIYETEPVGGVPQPLYFNLVVGIETTLSPESLLTVLLDIEQQHGRVRGERNGPRTLDLDLLVYEAETRETATLILPHPRMFERAFVLEPLRELLDRPTFSTAKWDALRERVSRPVASAGVHRLALML